MPDTETLELKEVKMMETEPESESKIEASVGENDVVALVDEAENLDSTDTSEEMNTDSCAQPDAVAGGNQKLLAEPTCESQDTVNTESDCIVNGTESEMITEHINRISETEIKDHSSEHIPEDTNSNTLVEIPKSANAKELTDPSMITSDDQESDSTTQPVLHQAGDKSQSDNKQEDAQIAKQEPKQEEDTSNQETDPSINVLKSVVETTITDTEMLLSTAPSASAGHYLIPPSTTTTTISSVEQPGPTIKSSPDGSQNLPMLVKPPKTDDLLQTAREVLQLRDKPPTPDVLIGELNLVRAEQ